MPRDTHTVPNSISAGVKYGGILKKTDSGDSLEASSGFRSWLGRIYGTGQALGAADAKVSALRDCLDSGQSQDMQDMELPSLPKALYRGLWWMKDPQIHRQKPGLCTQPARSRVRTAAVLAPKLESVGTSLFP